MSESLLLIVVLIPGMFLIGASLIWMMLGFPIVERHRHTWSNNMANATGVQVVTYTCTTCGRTKRKTVSVVC